MNVPVAYVSLQLLHTAVVMLPSIVLQLAGVGSADRRLLCFAALVVVAAAAEGIVAGRHAEPPIGNPRDPRALTVARFVGVFLLLSFWIAQLEYFLVPSGFDLLVVAGTTVAAAGIALRICAIAALGEFFVSDIRTDTAVIRTGIYRRMQHPSEVGLLCIAVGAPAMLAAVYTASVTAAVLLPVSVWRMQRENHCRR